MNTTPGYVRIGYLVANLGMSRDWWRAKGDTVKGLAMRDGDSSHRVYDLAACIEFMKKGRQQQQPAHGTAKARVRIATAKWREKRRALKEAQQP